MCGVLVLAARLAIATSTASTHVAFTIPIAENSSAALPWLGCGCSEHTPAQEHTPHLTPTVSSPSAQSSQDTPCSASQQACSIGIEPQTLCRMRDPAV